MPREISSLKPQVEALLLSTKRKGVENLIAFLATTDYYVAPASKNFHSSFIGGLTAHSCTVLNILSDKIDSLTVETEWREDTIIICSLLHDLCKIGTYKRNGAIYITEDDFPLGHGVKSVILAMEYIKLTDFEKMAITHHMGVPETYGDRMTFNRAVALYPNIIYLHLADFESSVVIEPIELERRRIK